MDSPPPTPGLSDIGQIAITVGDVTKATAFYRDVLGLKFLFSAGPNLAFFSAGHVRLMLSTPQGAGTVGKNSILFQSDRHCGGARRHCRARCPQCKRAASGGKDAQT